MCPKLKGTICDMVDVSPEYVECASMENCLSGASLDCAIYISQFFFDENDEYIGTPSKWDSRAA